MNYKPFRIAKSCGGKGWDPVVCFRGMEEAGIHTMELSFRTRERCEGIDWQEHIRLAKQHNIELWSYHLPFSKLDPSNPDESHRKDAVEFLCEQIRIAGNLGIQTCVLHSASGMKEDVPRQVRIDHAMDSLAQFAEVAARSGTVIAVENQPKIGMGREVEEMLQLLSADDRLMFCLDVNHLLLQPAEEYLPKIAHRLRTVHISDYDFKDERHWLPGEGLIDWQKMITLLKQADYKGPFLYEVSMGPSKTIDRRPLTYADIKANYDTLMAGKTPEPIGTPILENCIHWTQIKK